MEYTMISPPIKELLDKVENKYILSTLAAKRARELCNDNESLLEEEFVNIVTTAVVEIANDKIGYIDPEQEVKKKQMRVNLNDKL